MTTTGDRIYPFTGIAGPSRGSSLARNLSSTQPRRPDVTAVRSQPPRCDIAAVVAGGGAGGMAAVALASAWADDTRHNDEVASAALPRAFAECDAEPGSDLAAAGTAILSGDRVTFTADRPLPALPPDVVRRDRPRPGIPAVLVTIEKIFSRNGRWSFAPSLIVGAGASRGVPAEVGQLIDSTLAELRVSDLHTDGPVIERRIIAAAEADLMTCFYHPASSRRTWQLRRAIELPAARRLRGRLGPHPGAGRPDGNPTRLPVGSPGGEDLSEVDPIEVESYRVLRSRIDLSDRPPLSRAVTERIIHATADFDYVTDLVCDEAALAAGVAALHRDAPVIADVAMVASGITTYPVICKIGDSIAARLARSANLTLSAAAVRMAFGEAGPGGIWLVGCAPPALIEIISRQVEPALVIGLPVGFVGAAAAKDELRASGLPALTNVSEKGGPAVAVAAFNALLRIARDPAVDAAGAAR